MDNTTLIRINNLSKTFKNTTIPAVDDISFTINRNEIFGLLGPNGAGKTTTISMLCGLFSPSKGSVLINKLNFNEHLNQLKQLIGIVPQDIALYPTLTARENLNFFGEMYGVTGTQLKQRIDEWLSKLGLTEAANKRVDTFSGGMKRRVNLIAAVLHNPKILFLDEPTVGVDVQSRNVIIEHLKELNINGTTIIYTSHHMDEAEHFCSQVAIIDNGKIITQGSPKELIASSSGCDNLESVFLKLTKRKLRD